MKCAVLLILETYPDSITALPLKLVLKRQQNMSTDDEIMRIPISKISEVAHVTKNITCDVDRFQLPVQAC